MVVWRRYNKTLYSGIYIHNGIPRSTPITLFDKFKLVDTVLGEAFLKWHVGDTLTVIVTDPQGTTAFEGDYIYEERERMRWRIFNYQYKQQ